MTEVILNIQKYLIKFVTNPKKVRKHHTCQIHQCRRNRNLFTQLLWYPFNHDKQLPSSSLTCRHLLMQSRSPVFLVYPCWSTTKHQCPCTTCWRTVKQSCYTAYHKMATCRHLKSSKTHRTSVLRFGPFRKCDVKNDQEHLKWRRSKPKRADAEETGKQKLKFEIQKKRGWKRTRTIEINGIFRTKSRAGAGSEKLEIKEDRNPTSK